MFLNCHTHLKDFPDKSIYNQSIEEQIHEGYFSIGIHPWNAEKSADRFDEVATVSQNKFCVAIGETGLDKFHLDSFTTQKKLFEQHIQLSEDLKLPLIVHCVKAWNETKLIHRAFQPQQPWIFHGFSKVGILDNVLNTGLMISIGNHILNTPKLQDALCSIPNDRLLVETDDNSVDIQEIYQKICELKKISLLDLEQIIEQNFKQTFLKWHIG